MGEKKVNGRKRQFWVDTNGFLGYTLVHPAYIQGILETICLGFFVGVVGDPNTIGTDSVNNGLDVHKITLPNGFCLPLSRDTPRLQRDG
jgi:hypothetical protein